MRGRVVWRLCVLALFLGFMLVPLLATVLFSVSTRWDRTIWPEGLTLRWWQAVTARSAFQDTLLNSLGVAVATVAVSLALVTPTAYWAHLRAPKARPWIEFLAIVPFGLPGVVLALGLIRFYSGVPLPLINTPAILVAAYVVLTLPFMYRPLVNALEAVDARTLTEAAQSLGAGGADPGPRHLAEHPARRDQREPARVLDGIRRVHAGKSPGRHQIQDVSHLPRGVHPL
jgi:putative spermidine/putrescine transport system permease protein